MNNEKKKKQIKARVKPKSKGIQRNNHSAKLTLTKPVLALKTDRVLIQNNKA